jgi:hypothetical protein
VPALAPLLGAISAAPVYPAVAALRGSLAERAVLGALGWWCMLAAAGAAHVGSRLGLVDAAGAGWSRSTSAAASDVLAPLLDPQALLGAAVFAAAAVLLGIVLRARHIALALLGALLWAGGLEAALGVVADGRLAGGPVLVAAAAVAAVILEFRRRVPRPHGGWAPIPGVRLQIPGHSARPDTAIPGR